MNAKVKKKPDTTYVRLGTRRPALERVKKLERRPSISNVIETLLDEALERRIDEGRAS
jgi:hypothetical protein